MYVIEYQQIDITSFILKDLGVKCDTYHAGLNNTKRTQIHHQFLKDELQVIGFSLPSQFIRHITSLCFSV